LSIFRASASICDVARKLKLYDTYGASTIPHDISKQCRSREIFIVVVVNFPYSKLYPDVKFIRQLSEMPMLPEILRFCVNLYGYRIFLRLISALLSSAIVIP
jgi:hypothetical protein